MEREPGCSKSFLHSVKPSRIENCPGKTPTYMVYCKWSDVEGELIPRGWMAWRRWAPSLLPCASTIALFALAALLSLPTQVSGQSPIEYEPEFLEALENHTVTQGRDVSFTCVVNHLGPYKVAWIKSDSKAILAIHTHLVAHNNRLSVTHNGHNTWKLKVSNVQKNDSGTYMCQINTDPMRSQMGHLEVVIPPDVLNDDNPNDYVAVEGGTVTLRCKATGVPEPRVMWKREDGKSIVLRHDTGNKDTVRTFDADTLVLFNVQRTDMGSYLCIASNGVPPSVAKRFIVQVHFHPSVKVSNQLVAAPAGSDVHIQCYIETSPKAMHSWYRDTGEKLMGSSKYEMEEVKINEYSLFMNLTIKGLEKRDFGGYVCSSVNALGKAEGVVRLQELHIPKTTPAPSSNNNLEGRGRKKPTVLHGKEKVGPPPRRRKKPRTEEEGTVADEEKESTTPELRRGNGGAETTPRTPPWIPLESSGCEGLHFIITPLLFSPFLALV